MRKTVVCSDGLTRTGTVIYIGPIFQTLEFEAIGGRWRESFFLPIPPDRLAENVDGPRQKSQQRIFSAEEQQIILSDNLTINQMAERLGCSYTTIETYRRKMHAKSMRGKRRHA